MDIRVRYADEGKIESPRDLCRCVLGAEVSARERRGDPCEREQRLRRSGGRFFSETLRFQYEISLHFNSPYEI